MRFKATLKNITVFKEICGALASLRKLCQFHISPEEIKLVSLVDKNSTQLWSVHPTDLIFDEYTISSNEDDWILMELNIDSLYRAIRSYELGGRGTDGIRLRLKKQDKVSLLRIEFEHTALQSYDITYVRHEFPVRLIRIDEVAAIKEPQCPIPNLYLELPNPLKDLNRIIDKIKGLGSHVIIKCNEQGHISFEIDGNGLRIETTFKNGTIVEAVTDESETAPPTDSLREPVEPSVTVNVKDLSNVLQITNVVNRIVIGICNEYAIIFYCYLDRVLQVGETEEKEEVLTYYMSHLDV